ncbi:DeoR/GlpR family DNA-binding transcription regulator [Robinsoniella peoriensis]
MNHREEKILELLTLENKIEVARLSDLLDVSKVTIRKDLDSLEEKGLIKREHGFAVLGSREDMNYHLAFHYEKKKQIARAAAGMVQDGETLMIESGSCCILLADELARTKKDLTIITNSAFIAGYIRHYPTVQVILLGGTYQKDSQAVVGPLTIHNVRTFFVNRLFIGIDGFQESFGFTGSNLMRREVIRAMSEQAEYTTILTECEKFSQKGAVSLLQYDEVSCLITDSGISDEIAEFLKSKGVNVTVV